MTDAKTIYENYGPAITVLRGPDMDDTPDQHMRGYSVRQPIWLREPRAGWTPRHHERLTIQRWDRRPEVVPLRIGRCDRFD